MSTTLRSYLEQEKKKKEEAKTSFYGYLLSPLVLGALFYWDNYVWIQWPIAYWQWCILSLGTWVIPKWVRKFTLGPIFAVTVIGQLAKWCGLVILPLIK